MEGEALSSSVCKTLLLGLLRGVFAATVACAPADAQQQQKTNIVIIWGMMSANPMSAPTHAA